MRIKLKQVNDIDIFTHPYIFIYLLYIYTYKLSFIIRCLSNIFYFTLYYIIVHVAFNVFCSYLWIITMVCIFIYMLYELLYRRNLKKRIKEWYCWYEKRNRSKGVENYFIMKEDYISRNKKSNWESEVKKNQNSNWWKRWMGSKENRETNAEIKLEAKPRFIKQKRA